MPRTAFDQDASLQPLSPRARSAMRLGALVGAAVLLLVAAGPLWLLTVQRGELGLGSWLLGMAVLAVLVAGSGWSWAGVAWRRTGWRLDEDGLVIRRGVFWRNETLVPRSRVQHVDLGHGPVDRRFGLAGLKVHTAGTRLAAVSLGGLDQAQAEALRDALVAEPAAAPETATPITSGPSTSQPTASGPISSGPIPGGPLADGDGDGR